MEVLRGLEGHSWGYVRMCARVRVRMVTDSGQREGVRGRRTGERTAGQQETWTAETGGTGDRRRDRRTGQRETVTDRETGTAGQERGVGA